ncbi:MAG: phosphatidate cytidylyltransferase [Vicinamibacterales bacterium]
MTRLVSGVALGAAALAAILFLPAMVLRVLACGVAALAAHEYLTVTQSKTSLPVLALVAAGCWLVPEWRGDLALRLMMFLAAWVALTVLWRGTSLQDAGVQAFAPLYIGLPLGMLLAVHMQTGARVTLLLIGTVVVSDSAQYYTGRMFGRHPLAPTISPKKTREGALGGVLFGTLFMVGIGRLFLGAPVATLALLGALIVAAGICGDLFESRLKRASGVKDSSSIIPGHGGVLDRIDALLFAAPVFYFYLQAARP